jgi:hypothetical protein
LLLESPILGPLTTLSLPEGVKILDFSLDLLAELGRRDVSLSATAFVNIVALRADDGATLFFAVDALLTKALFVVLAESRLFVVSLTRLSFVVLTSFPNSSIDDT